MEWWAWVLIGAGVIALGAVKLMVWNKIKQAKAAKAKLKAGRTGVMLI